METPPRTKEFDHLNPEYLRDLLVSTIKTLKSIHKDVTELVGLREEDSKFALLLSDQIDAIKKTLKALPKPKDGISVVSGEVNKRGELVISLSDGKKINCGVVQGEDGNDATEINADEVVQKVLDTLNRTKKSDLKDVEKLISSQIAKIQFPKPDKIDVDALKRGVVEFINANEGIIDVNAVKGLNEAINYLLHQYRASFVRSSLADVIGPESSTAGDLAIFLDNKGKNIGDSGKKISDLWQKSEFLPISAGLTAIPNIVDNGNGSITIDPTSCNLFSAPDGNSEVFQFNVAGGTFTLPDGVSSYAIVDYNAGVPLLSVVTDVSVINETTIIPVNTFFRQGNEIHAENWDELAFALPNKLNQSIVKTQRFRRESGLELSEVSPRKVKIAAGVSYRGAVRNPSLAFDQTTDEVHLWYHSAGNWTDSMVTQYNNSQYDNGTNLVALPAGKYAVNFVYKCLSYIHNDAFIVLGGGAYNLNQALASQPPANLPAIIKAFGILVGRIIVPQGSDITTQIDSAFVTAFTPTATPSTTFAKSFVITNPTVNSDLPLWRVPNAATITAVHLLCKGQIITGQLWQFDANGLNGQAIDTANLTGIVDTNVNDDGTLANPVITAGNYLGWVTATATAGALQAIVSFEGYFN